MMIARMLDVCSEELRKVNLYPPYGDPKKYPEGYRWLDKYDESVR